jgi:sterol desaturase/sphingolipid hydroxylase (fatty acid hydroxylase superfamily)
MDRIKLLVVLASLCLGGMLVVLAEWYGSLQSALRAHSQLSGYLLLSVVIAIPARILALSGAYLIELAVVGWRQSGLRMLWRPAASVKLDIVSIAVMLLLPHRYLGYALSLGLLYAVDVYAAQLHRLSVTPLLPSWTAQIVCFVLFQSCLRYWIHRAEHGVPLLWALHKFHHSAERLSLLTSARNTQLTKGFEDSLAVLPAALLSDATLPAPTMSNPLFLVAIIYFLYRTIVSVNGYFCHSSMTTDYGWFGRWLLVSPRMHRLHHARTPAYHDKNFSFDLVIWDRLFGTYVTCDAATDPRTLPLGLDDNPFHEDGSMGGALREYFVKTYRVFWQEFSKGPKVWLPQRRSDRRGATTASSAASHHDDEVITDAPQQRPS